MTFHVVFLSVGVNDLSAQTCSRSISHQDEWMSASDHTHTHTQRESETEREREREFLSVTFTGLINALGAFLTLFTACLSLKHIPSHQTSVTKYIIRSIRQNTFSARNHAHRYCIRKKAKKGQWHFAEVSRWVPLLHFFYHILWIKQLINH